MRWVGRKLEEKKARKRGELEGRRKEEVELERFEGGASLTSS